MFKILKNIFETEDIKVLTKSAKSANETIFKKINTKNKTVKNSTRGETTILAGIAVRLISEK